MKKTAIFTAMLVLTALFASAQECYRDASLVLSIGGGPSANGGTEYMEVGMWGISQPFGIVGGAMMYNQTKTNKDGQSYTQPYLDFYARASMKMDRNENEGFHHALTGTVSLQGMLQVSYRAYYQFAYRAMIGVEPAYSNKNQFGCNILLTVSLN